MTAHPLTGAQRGCPHHADPHPAPHAAPGPDVLAPGEEPVQRVRDGRADPDDAEAFLRQFHRERPEAGPVEPRLRQALAEIADTGTYTHTRDELVFGARVAWRNAGCCLGRLYWQSLVVRDLRHVSSAEQIAAACFDHLRRGHNGGRVRPLVSVFAPDRPGRPGPRVRNGQLVSYAGARRRVGDPKTADTTALARRLGWPDPVGEFTVLPLIVQEHPALRPRWFRLPEDTVHEVAITHPRLAWFAELGLRWHAVPAVSHLALEVGGVCYPSAPQNGWYMVTEIGARNLGDTGRYDLLPEVARRLGLDTAAEDSLWRDRALVELNVAVLHSFRRAGVTMADHHTEARRFLTHIEREERAGRAVPADWSWLVPPISGSATAVFHRYYDPVPGALRPAFVARLPW
ncbi:nitric oxide synthase oxygenase [Streptomonospora nanhaiensis]|uniref:nitric oxide synthase oxygenase n=1 Tax=Streptomonospora nanhaiensis TaxID=1323731 RepID=UPI001C99B138|nr:nitric oxide synthase oxygenase [Streptomonospora nanhaiensis]MBX9388099.1 nitric oxide synthase oxygenase [Streptomonospora nanhaiensis]